jgi:deoxyribodipyrimidine photo-lyase
MEVRTLNPAFENLEYEDRSDFLEAWITGQTGYPMVDACMRCLGDTGFMNFRMRAMVVSFACFGLHLSWRFIHEPLAQLFTDYEPGIHISQLQMQAGVTGFNALRVYSPMKQFLDQDPDAKFVKHWVPELSDRKSVEIARASEMRFPEYSSALVGLSERSKDMKAKIFAIRKSQTARIETENTLQETWLTKEDLKEEKSKRIQDQLKLRL